MQTISLSSNTSWYLYNFRAATIRRLRNEGFHVVCLSPPDDYTDKLVHELGCEWAPLAMHNQGSNPFSDAGLVYQFWRHYRRTRPVAALHFTIKNNVYGTWAAAALNIPAINNVSGLGTAFIRKGLVPGVARLLYRTSQPLAFRVFCQNDDDRARLVASGMVPADRLELLPGSGVDLTRFTPALRRPHDGPLRFLYAGRMLYDKGLNELVAATRAINNGGVRCQLWLSGFAGVDNVSAIPREQLERWGEEPAVCWLGASDRMEDRYAEVDCVVLPSYREGMPRSLLEAGAMGLPVIASDVPGCRDVVQDGATGLLCAAQDSRSLRAAMERMLAMTDQERVEMGARGRALVAARFDEEFVVQATLRAIESATARR